MQGILHKWTNMFSGWQPRWFILENGVLSYYKSLDEVSLGSKGSLKMSVCDVNVHPHDSTRLDLVIPGEQHFYIKAATTQERQLWLVALGSAKACLSNGVAPTSSGKMSPEIVRTKRSELRLYCDLLLQQVCEVKAAVSNSDSPDIERLDEATQLLRATCETFISTLEGCMQLANAHAAIDRSLSGDGPPSPSRSHSTRLPLSRTVSEGNCRRVSSPVNHDSVSVTRSTSEPSDPPHTDHSVPPKEAADKPPEDFSSPSPVFNTDTTLSTAPHADLSQEDARSLDQDIFEDAPEPNNNLSHVHIDTFFTTLGSTFADVHINPTDSLIPTEAFLEACRCSSALFDKFNSAAFAPVKMDVSGNIRKIHQKYSTDPKGFEHLQTIVLYELSYKQHLSSSSVTSALLWLKRAMEFLLEFLSLLDTTDLDLTTLTTQAYSKTLKPYHSWVVRGVFTLAVKAMPYREAFIESLCINPAHVKLPQYESTLLTHIRAYTSPLGDVLHVLQSFYTTHDLDLDEQV